MNVYNIVYEYCKMDLVYKIKVNETKKEIIKCDCGYNIFKRNKSRHEKTKRHNNLVSLL